MKKFLSIPIFLLLSSVVFGQTTTLVKVGTDGKLVYTPDAKGNIIPDFSAVGYKSGNEPIPNVAVVRTISAVAGDNTANIQNAINAVAALPLDANGIRGALLLKAGTYNINNTINIRSSGVIIRGEGNSTVLMATKTSQYNLISVSGSGGASAVGSTSKKIQGSYIPVGAKTFTLLAGHGFVAGDDVMLQRKPNQAWINMLGMDRLNEIPCDNGGCNTDWTPGEYTINYLRKVVAVNGNSITLDAPNVDVIDSRYAEAFIMKYTWTGKIEKVGVEKLYIDSKYTSVNDENHGWHAVSFSNAKNCWVNTIEVHHFGYAAVTVNESAAFVSILNSKNLDPISQTIGGRKYSFNINGQRNLVKNCATRGGRHDYVTGAQVAGPNVFVNSTSTNQQSDIGPHHRWATGALFDKLTGNTTMNAQNRLGYGTGHGWAGSQTMFWNCTAAKLIVQSPPNHMNWAIGCKGNVTDRGDQYTGSPCISQSTGTHIAAIPSLYEHQLADRLGPVGNQAPTVSFTSPANNATFTAGTSITINANALDSDGSVAKVEFFVDGNKISEDLTSPHSAAWTAVAGSHSLTAKATDDKGASTVSIAISITVTAVVTQSPYGGTVRNIPGIIEAEHYDEGGQGIAYNDLTTGNAGNIFRMDNVDVQATTDAGAGYNIGWVETGEWLEYTVNVISAGSYAMDVRVASIAIGKTFHIELDGQNISGAIVVPNTGAYQTFQTVTATTPSLTAGQKTMRIVFDVAGINLNYVIFTSSIPNNAPATTITSPTANSSFMEGTAIAINAEASDSDGVISKVEFFSGTTKIGEDVTSPYSINWMGATSGTYSLSTKAIDDKGAVATSQSVAVIISAAPNNAPAVSITSPSGGTSFTAPATISINASASDSDGSVVKVEFFRGATKIGEDAIAPYSIIWSGAAAGTYSLTAKATDNKGATTTSSSVSIIVKASTNTCSGIATYIENGGYIAGSKVQNSGSHYQCKPYPYSGWCNGAAWAYAPGVGSYWQDAWTLVGTCSASRTVTSTNSETALITSAPNPFGNSTTITIHVEHAGETSVIVYDKMGREVAVLANGYFTEDTYSFTLDGSNLKAGIYVCKFVTNDKVTMSSIVKQ